jgi:hypothetical protein
MLFLFWRGGDVTEFSKVAPYLQDPLVLVGFFLFLAFLFARALLKRGIIPTLPPTAGFKILKSLLLYGFLIGLLLIVLGFGLKYAELRVKEKQAEEELMSRERQAQIDRDVQAQRDAELQEQDLARQRNTIALLRGELDDNLKVANELRKNTIVFLSGFQTLSQVVRTPGIELLTAMFPAENIDLKIPDSQAAGLADKVFDDLERSQLHKNDLELRKFTAAARAITTSIDLQMSTIQRLQDAGHTRYVFQSQIWQTNLPILRNIVVGDVPAFENSYADLQRLRNDYDVVTEHYVEYLEALREFFDPQKHSIGREGLRRALGRERYALQLVTAFGTMLTSDMQHLKSLDGRLGTKATAIQTKAPGRSKNGNAPISAVTRSAN